MLPYTIETTIQGTAPLLQHQFPLAALAGLQEGARRKSGSPDYTGEWIDRMYASDGRLYQPASHLEAAMARAAANFRIAGSRTRTYRDLFRAYVIVEPEEVPLLWEGTPIPAPGPELLQLPTPALRVDIRRAVVNRAAIARARLRIAAGWQLRFTIAVHDSQIRPDVVQTILQDAGIAAGIGDYRPRFGRFAVCAWSVRSPA